MVYTEKSVVQGLQNRAAYNRDALGFRSSLVVALHLYRLYLGDLLAFGFHKHCLLGHAGGGTSRN
jgi:hypothetical protein